MYISIFGKKVALDSRIRDADMNFVSHAHSDHISGIRKGIKTITSLETSSLVEAKYGKQIELADLQGTKLLNAGHILGSKQLYAYDENPGYSLVYTGDYQVSYSKLAGHIEIENADILIMDSTYPYPDVKFENREEVIEGIRRFSERGIDNGIVLFGAYAIGKAQELVEILNSAGIVPVVSKEITKANRVYNSFGFNLEYLSAYEENPEFDSVVRRNFVGIVEMHKLNDLAAKLSRLHRKKVYTAVTTGFASIFKFNTSAQFPLSDHADFAQAVEYIERCNPKYIFTCGREEELFARNLSALGYNANPISSRNSRISLQILEARAKKLQ